MRRSLQALLLAALGTAQLTAACDYPDEGNMPLRRAVSRVKNLPDVRAWGDERHKAGDVVQYRLLLEPKVFVKSNCYWTVEVTANGALWRRFYVSPDGKRVLQTP